MESGVERHLGGLSCPDALAVTAYVTKPLLWA